MVNNRLAVLEKANEAMRCNAKTRLCGTCRSPAMKNGRCRMHGGMSTGAPKGHMHGKFKHGNYTKELKSFFKETNFILYKSMDVLNDITNQAPN